MIENRISRGIAPREMIFAMSNGNIGAERICLLLLAYSFKIDPDSLSSDFRPIFYLDSLGIYEDEIYMLYKDVCGKNLSKMIALLRAHQLGLAGVDINTLNHAIYNYGHGINLNAVVAAVMDRLPNFQIDDVDY
jgi:hypothetical protein